MSTSTDTGSYPPPAPPPSLSITPHVAESALAEVIVLMVFEFIALVCVGLRIYSRIKKGGRFYFNDYAIFWALLWASALVFDSLASILQGGTGHHITEIIELAPGRLPTMAKLFLAAQFTWAFANAGVKISIIDLYIKIFGGSRRFRQVCYVIMGFVAAYCLVVILIAFLICHPFAYNWDATIPGGYCGDRRGAFLGSGIINLVLDLAVIILPMPMLWRLRMPVHKKINLSFMFGVGFLICAITIWRMVTIQNLDFSDTFFKAGYLGITSCLEPLLGIANACFPVLQPAAAAAFKPLSSMRSRLVGHGTNASRSKQSSWSGRDGDGDGHGNRVETSESRNFKKLYNHLFPVSEMDNSSEITATSTLHGDDEESVMPKNRENRITLTQEFEVTTQENTDYQWK